MRDEYVYDLEEVYESIKYTKQGVPILNPIPTKLYNGFNIENLIKEYTRLKSSDKDNLKEVKEIVPLNKETYIPAWLAIFPTSNPINANGVDLHLQVDQESPDGLKPEKLEDDGTILTFETSAGIVVTPSEISLGKLITKDRKERVLNSSVTGLSSKTVQYYKDESVTINIKATGHYSEAGYVKVIAKSNGKTRNVGLLMMYPNSSIPKADIRMVQFGTTAYDSNHPQTLQVELPRNYQDTIKTKSFNQALIKAEVDPADNINFRLTDELNKYRLSGNKLKADAIEKFLNNYPSLEIPRGKLSDYDLTKERLDPNFATKILDPNYKNQLLNSKFETKRLNLRDDIINLLEVLELEGNFIDSNDNKKTYAIFTDFVVGGFESAIGGMAYARSITDNEKASCKLDGASCTMIWGNAVVYFYTGKESQTLVHELGHSFGLAHTFIPPNQPPSSEHTFYKGYTDNLMDYKSRFNPYHIPRARTSNPFNEHLKALFKWQWDIIRNDRSMNQPNT